MATNVLCSQQYTFGARKCQVGKNLRQIPRCNQLFVSATCIILCIGIQ